MQVLRRPPFTIEDILRSERACAADLRDPGVVLEMLNDAFPVERHNGWYFTIWYGVYDRRTRTLEYATGGHPPAVLVTSDLGAERAALVHHPDPGLVIGAMPDMPYMKGEIRIPAGSRLFIFSDGIYEVASRRGRCGSRLPLELDGCLVRVVASWARVVRAVGGGAVSGGGWGL